MERLDDDLTRSGNRCRKVHVRCARRHRRDDKRDPRFKRVDALLRRRRRRYRVRADFLRHLIWCQTCCQRLPGREPVRRPHFDGRQGTRVRGRVDVGRVGLVVAVGSREGDVLRAAGNVVVCRDTCQYSGADGRRGGVVVSRAAFAERGRDTVCSIAVGCCAVAILWSQSNGDQAHGAHCHYGDVRGDDLALAGDGYGRRRW